MIERIRLEEDGRRNEWRLSKRAANYAESIFLSLEDAIGKLPDAIGNTTAVVEIHDSSGAMCGAHILRANRKR